MRERERLKTVMADFDQNTKQVKEEKETERFHVPENSGVGGRRGRRQLHSGGRLAIGAWRVIAEGAL